MNSRRRFISTVAASGTVIGTMGMGAFGMEAIEQSPDSSRSSDKPEWIDAHVHVWTDDIKAYPISDPYKVADMVPASFTPEELFAHSKPQQVAKIVLIQMSFYGFDNRYMLDCMEKYSGVFAGVAIVDETKANLKNTMSSLQDKGVRGFRLYTDRDKARLWRESAGMKEMWSNAADLGQSMCLLANPDALPFVNGMCELYPKTRVVIDHFARIGVSGRVEKDALDELCRLAKYENVFVKTSAFYALGQKKAPYKDLGAMVQRLVSEFGAKRLMWASDCPYQVAQGHDYASSIGLIRYQLDFLTPEDKRWMLRETAEHVFF
jgi:predicted TIM-barrel fold metal-dependent hydrolase